VVGVARLGPILFISLFSRLAQQLSSGDAFEEQTTSK
jgi:hypothetical protein